MEGLLSGNLLSKASVFGSSGGGKKASGTTSVAQDVTVSINNLTFTPSRVVITEQRASDNVIMAVKIITKISGDPSYWNQFWQIDNTGVVVVQNSTQATGINNKIIDNGFTVRCNTSTNVIWAAYE